MDKKRRYNDEEFNQITLDIHNEMVAAGRDPNDHHFYFDMVAERTKRFFAGKRTFAQICADNNARWAAAAAERARFEYKPVSLTPEEIDYLIWKLQGVNEPVGLDLRERLEAALPEKKDD